MNFKEDLERGYIHNPNTNNSCRPIHIDLY